MSFHDLLPRFRREKNLPPDLSPQKSRSEEKSPATRCGTSRLRRQNYLKVIS
jgi:hypothetical protein